MLEHTSSWPWDTRSAPGRTSDDPMCINLDCPSCFSCRRFNHEPWQGKSGPTIAINPEPDVLGGRLCGNFDPDCIPPRDKRSSKENPGVVV